MSQTQSPLDREPIKSEIVRLIQQGESNTYIAEQIWDSHKIFTTEASIRRFKDRHNIELPKKGKVVDFKTGEETPGFYQDDDKAEYVGPVSEDAKLNDPDKMMRERGLDPTEWKVDSASLNEWDNRTSEGIIQLHQAKFYFKRKPTSGILPARSDGWKPSVTSFDHSDEPELIVVCGDQQAPFHDKDLHKTFLAWLEENAPEKGIILGDLMDFPDISKYRPDPDNIASANECIQSGYDLVRGYVQASPRTKWQFMPGNHDIRLEALFLDTPTAQPLFDLKRATTKNGEKERVHSISHLLRFDELGVEFVDPHGRWELGQVNIAPKLAVRHGWITRKGSGASALATLDHLRYSVIVGHTHRQSLIYKTTHDINGEISTLAAAEAGCMCRVDQKVLAGRRFPNYTPSPDWNQGFCTATVHKDGLFRIDHGSFIDGNLLWRDQIYS